MHAFCSALKDYYKQCYETCEDMVSFLSDQYVWNYFCCRATFTLAEVDRVLIGSSLLLAWIGLVFTYEHRRTVLDLRDHVLTQDVSVQK